MTVMDWKIVDIVGFSPLLAAHNAVWPQLLKMKTVNRTTQAYRVHVTDMEC